MIPWHSYSGVMARLSISIPEELLQELEAKQSKYRSFSGFCCFLLEKGLKTVEREEKILEGASSAINQHNA